MLLRGNLKKSFMLYILKKNIGQKYNKFSVVALRLLEEKSYFLEKT